MKGREEISTPPIYGFLILRSSFCTSDLRLPFPIGGQQFVSPSAPRPRGLIVHVVTVIYCATPNLQGLTSTTCNNPLPDFALEYAKPFDGTLRVAYKVCVETTFCDSMPAPDPIPSERPFRKVCVQTPSQPSWGFTDMM